ncbi:MAG: glycosyltransferase family 2 protein, partial [Leptolyngbyaceae cyanobacterium]
ISLQRRLDTIILIKERFYQHESPKHQFKLPSLNTILQYLILHWMIVALKQKQFPIALDFGIPAIFSPKAWQLLQQAVNFRKQKSTPPIAKLILE